MDNESKKRSDKDTHLTTKTKEELSASFGAVISKYRTAAGKNQSELAKLMNTSRNTVTNWERGKNLPDMAAARQLAIYLNIPLYELFDIPTTELPSSEEKQLLRQYRYLSEVGKKVVLEMAKTIVSEEDAARGRAIKEKYVILPLESTPAAAGTGCPDTGEPPEPFFVKKNGISERAKGIVRVSGDSMEPIYHDGDYVYVEYTQDAYDEEDVICVYHEGFIIKRRRGNKLYSLNKERDFGDNHEFDDIRMVGRVLGILSVNDKPDKSDAAFLDDLFTAEIRNFNRKYRR